MSVRIAQHCLSNCVISGRQGNLLKIEAQPLQHTANWVGRSISSYKEGFINVFCFGSLYVLCFCRQFDGTPRGAGRSIAAYRYAHKHHVKYKKLS